MKRAKKKEILIKDYQQLVQEVYLIILNWEDKLNKHNSAKTVVEHILGHKAICDQNPHDTILYAITPIKGLKSYPVE